MWPDTREISSKSRRVKHRVRRPRNKHQGAEEQTTQPERETFEDMNDGEDTRDTCPPVKRMKLGEEEGSETHTKGSANKPSPSTPSIRELGFLKLSGQYQWYKLGSQLGGEQHVLEQIEENYRLFGEWLRRDTEASWNKLCAAIQNVGEDKLVKHIASRYELNIQDLLSSHVTKTQQCDDRPENLPQCIYLHAKDMKELFCDMDVLPTGDWPPSIGRHESKIALIEHGRGTLPGAKEAEEIQRLYIGGNVDRILESVPFAPLGSTRQTRHRLVDCHFPLSSSSAACISLSSSWKRSSMDFAFVISSSLRFSSQTMETVEGCSQHPSPCKTFCTRQFCQPLVLHLSACSFFLCVIL